MLLIPLSRLLTEGRAADAPVALRRGAFVSFGRFKADISDAAVRFESCRRAALICQDSYHFAVGFYGLLHAGAQIILPPNGQPGTLQALKDQYDFLVDDAVAADYQNNEAVLSPLDAERLSLLFFTSGSTGQPKKIGKSLAILEREIAALDALWGRDSGHGPVFATVSHQHIYGLTFKLLWPLMAGRVFCAEMHGLWEDLCAGLSPDAAIISSPAHLDRLEGLNPLPLSQRPRRIFSAGAPLPLRASRQAQAVFGCAPTEIFGSTETGAFATRCQITGDEGWQLLPGIEIKTDDEKRLAIRSAFMGPDWMETSDLVEPAGQGFRFLGRADRIAKVEGKRVALADIENTLEQSNFIEKAAVAVLPGTPDRLVAAVVPSAQGQQALTAEGKFRFGRLLRDQLSATQEAAGIPRLWRFVDALPTYNMGKCRDADIRALFGEEA